MRGGGQTWVNPGENFTRKAQETANEQKCIIIGLTERLKRMEDFSFHSNLIFVISLKVLEQVEWKNSWLR